MALAFLGDGAKEESGERLVLYKPDSRMLGAESSGGGEKVPRGLRTQGGDGVCILVSQAAAVSGTELRPELQEGVGGPSGVGGVVWEWPWAAPCRMLGRGQACP